MVISGTLPVNLPVKILLNQKLRIKISGGLGDSFFYTVIIQEAISEKQPLGKKIAKKRRNC